MTRRLRKVGSGFSMSPSSSPVQDTGLSRRRRRFKSGWGRYIKSSGVLSGYPAFFLLWSKSPFLPLSQPVHRLLDIVPDILDVYLGSRYLLVTHNILDRWGTEFVLPRKIRCDKSTKGMEPESFYASLITQTVQEMATYLVAFSPIGTGMIVNKDPLLNFVGSVFPPPQ